MEEIGAVKKKESFSKLIKKNPWMISTFVFGILAIILIINSFALTGNVTGEQAGEKFVNFFNEKAGANIEYVSSEPLGKNLYDVTFLIEGQEVPGQLTRDGKYFVQVLYELEDSSSTTNTNTNTNTNIEIPKTDKPVVDLFIWSYCPYGVTALSPFADVASLLGNFADFKVYLYYAGHGEHEEQQNKIQACIQELEPAKYWNYAKGFASDIYTKCSGDIACDKTESVALMKSLGINSNDVLSCVTTRGDSLLEEHLNVAKGFGVQGSPSLVVNGVIASPSGRTSEAFKQTICEAFNTAPEKCSTTLDSTGSTTTGNC